MKGIWGSMLVGLGLILFVRTIAFHDSASSWYRILWLGISGGIFFLGLYLSVDEMIDDRLKKFKKEILREIRD